MDGFRQCANYLLKKFRIIPLLIQNSIRKIFGTVIRKEKVPHDKSKLIQKLITLVNVAWKFCMKRKRAQANNL